jgi:hypothetical protein
MFNSREQESKYHAGIFRRANPATATGEFLNGE